VLLGRNVVTTYQASQTRESTQLHVLVLIRSLDGGDTQREGSVVYSGVKPQGSEEVVKLAVARVYER
jgi:hypothetical protein